MTNFNSKASELVRLKDIKARDIAEVQGIGIFYLGGEKQPIMNYLCSTSLRPLYEFLCNVFDLTSVFVPYGTLTAMHGLQGEELG